MLVNGVETSELDDDLFAAGFDEAAGGGENPPESDEKTPEELETERVAAETAETERVAAETAEAERVAAEKAEAEKPAPVDVDKLVADAVAAAVKATAPVKEEPAATAEPSAEDLAAEAQFRKDWPEHAAREDRLKGELEGLKKLLTETTELLKGQIAPVVESVNLTAEEKHFNTIYAAHADADAIVPDVKKWIETQPKFLQPQYIAVLEKGSAAAVVELFTTYKEATKTAEPNAEEKAAAEKAATEKAATEKAEAERKEKLNRMKGITTLRTSSTAEEDPSDFDSAFDAEAKKIAV